MLCLLLFLFSTVSVISIVGGHANEESFVGMASLSNTDIGYSLLTANQSLLKVFKLV